MTEPEYLKGVKLAEVEVAKGVKLAEPDPVTAFDMLNKASVCTNLKQPHYNDSQHHAPKSSY